MPKLSYKGRDIFFIHIPKTGGTSIYANLLAQHGTIDQYAPHGATQHGITRHHYHLELLKTDPSFNVLDKFCFIRSPLERTLSAYFYRNQSQISFDIEHFNAWLYITIKKYNNNNSTYDNHFRPQTEFFDSTVTVFDFANRQPAYCWIKDKLNFNSTYRSKKLPKHASIICPTTIEECIHPINRINWLEIYKHDITAYNDLTTV